MATNLIENFTIFGIFVDFFKLINFCSIFSEIEKTLVNKESANFELKATSQF